jgi:hypothetical protein
VQRLNANEKLIFIVKDVGKASDWKRHTKDLVGKKIFLPYGINNADKSGDGGSFICAEFCFKNPSSIEFFGLQNCYSMEIEEIQDGN